ncbi:MAG: glycosyltransferase, partial [Pseudomonadota bacterium]
MPVRNCGALLRSAADSIIAQTWPRWELIVVDDHSSDGSPERLCGLDPRIRVVRNPGRGIVAALNAGAAAASGEFLARMDGDDIALPWRLEAQLALLGDAPDIGIAGGRVEIFGGAPQLAAGYRAYQRWINALVTPHDIAREIFIESPIPHPTAMLRRDVFDALGGYRDTPWAEDYDLWLRAFQAGVPMAKPREVVLRWRDAPARLSRTSARYSQHNFLRAKAHFLARTGLRGREAVIWGAGPTGRRLCDA